MDRISSKKIRRYILDNRPYIRHIDMSILLLLMDPDDMMELLVRNKIGIIVGMDIGYNLPKNLSLGDIRKLMWSYSFDAKRIFTQYFNRHDIVQNTASGIPLLEAKDPFAYGYQQYMASMAEEGSSYRDVLTSLSKIYPASVYLKEIENPRSLDIIPEFNRIEYSDPRELSPIWNRYMNHELRLPTAIMDDITYPPRTSSSDVLGIIKSRNLSQLDLTLLALLLNRDDAIEAIRYLRDRTPYIYGFKLNASDFHILRDSNVPTSVIRAFSTHIDMATADMLEYVLQYTNDLYTENIYYFLLNKISKEEGDHRSEVNILRSIPDRYILCKRRLNAIYIIRDNNVSSSGCSNSITPVGIRVKNVPPFLIYALYKDDKQFCLSMSDLYNMLIHRRYINPWTNEDIDPTGLTKALFNVMREGYPIAYSTYRSFIRPVRYTPIALDLSEQGNTIITDTYNLPIDAMRDILPLIVPNISNPNDLIKQVYPKSYRELGVVF